MIAYRTLTKIVGQLYHYIYQTIIRVIDHADMVALINGTAAANERKRLAFMHNRCQLQAVSAALHDVLIAPIVTAAARKQLAAEAQVGTGQPRLWSSGVAAPLRGKLHELDSEDGGSGDGEARQSGATSDTGSTLAPPPAGTLSLPVAGSDSELGQGSGLFAAAPRTSDKSSIAAQPQVEVGSTLDTCQPESEPAGEDDGTKLRSALVHSLSQTFMMSLTHTSPSQPEFD